MINVGQIDALMSELAPKELSESWDNDGVMLCRDLKASVKRVLCALEVRDSTVKFASDGGFDLIVTHHPFIFHPLKRIDMSEYALFEKLVKNNISVLSYHTRLDSANGGMNDVLAQKLCLSDVSSFGSDGGNLGRLGKLGEKLSGEAFGRFLKQKLDCKSIRASLFSDAGKAIETVAVVGGAGKDFVYEAKKAGADAFVTSEIPHHIFIEAKRLDMCLYDCGHYYTENIITEKIHSTIQNAFPELYVEEFDVQSPYECL